MSAQTLASQSASATLIGAAGASAGGRGPDGRALRRGNAVAVEHGPPGGVEGGGVLGVELVDLVDEGEVCGEVEEVVRHRAENVPRGTLRRLMASTFGQLFRVTTFGE